MSTTMKRALGAVVLVVAVIVAGCEKFGYLPAGTTLFLTPFATALGVALPSPLIRTGK